MLTPTPFHRAWLAWSAVLALASACADQSVVGENDGPFMNGAEAPDSTSRRCETRRMLTALPASEINYEESPALWIETARGTWGNAKGDTLEIAIDQLNTRVEWICDENSTIPSPAGPRPHVSFELTGELALHTADGAWDERVPVRYSLAPGPAGTPFSMMLRGTAAVSLSTLQGTFRFPAELPAEPSGGVLLIVEYQNGGWVLQRIARAFPRTGAGESCGCGDLAPAWEGERLLFVRR